MPDRCRTVICLGKDSCRYEKRKIGFCQFGFGLCDFGESHCVSLRESVLHGLSGWNRSGKACQQLRDIGRVLCTEVRSCSSERSIWGECCLSGTCGDFAEYTIQIQQAGFYHISLRYALLAEHSEKIKIGIQIDGETPFLLADDISLGQEFQNKVSEFEQDKKAIKSLRIK